MVKWEGVLEELKKSDLAEMQRKKGYTHTHTHTYDK